MTSSSATSRRTLSAVMSSSSLPPTRRRRGPNRTLTENLERNCLSKNGYATSSPDYGLQATLHRHTNYALAFAQVLHREQAGKSEPSHDQANWCPVSPSSVRSRSTSSKSSCFGSSAARPCMASSRTDSSVSFQAPSFGEAKHGEAGVRAVQACRRLLATSAVSPDGEAHSLWKRMSQACCWMLTRCFTVPCFTLQSRSEHSSRPGQMLQ